MRIISLELNAYGPFGGKAFIDFTDLNAAGIFLLNGPTGSGKSSILDAICYALYGSTSLNRPELRSLFAPEDAEPYVLLEFEVAGQAYRIRRSPAWNRPKKRKVGDNPYRSEPAKVDLDRYNSSSALWEDLSDRIAEASTFITDLMGLTREQFTQVILLPQGEFARFLLSSSKDREELLKKLFSTLEFERVQEELKVLARTAEEKVSTQEELLATLKHDAFGAVERADLDQLADKQSDIAALLPVEETSDQEEISTLETAPEALAEASEEGDEFLTYLSHYQQLLQNENNKNQSLLAQANSHYQGLLTQVQELEQLAKNWQVHDQLQVEAAALNSQAKSMDELAHIIERAIAARAVLQPAQQRDRAQANLQTSQESLTQAEQEVIACQQAVQLIIAENPQVPEAKIDLAEINQSLAVSPDQRENVQEVLRQLQNLQERENELARLELAITGYRNQLQGLVEKQKLAQAQEKELTEKIAKTSTFLETHSQAQLEAAQAQQLLHQAAQNLVKAQELARLQAQTPDLEAALEKANRVREEANQQVNDLYTLRYQQAAISLAGQLQDGEPCPVCGGLEHPTPAKTQDFGKTVEEKDLEKASQRRAQAEAKSNEAFASLQSHQQTILRAQQEGTPELDSAQTELEQAKTQAQQLQEVLKEVQMQEQQLADLKKQEQLQQEASQAQSIQISQLAVLHSQAQAEQDRLAEELELVASQVSLGQRVERVRQLITALDSFQLRQTQLSHAQENLETAQKQLADLLTDSNFADLDTARAASLEASKLASSQIQLEDYQRKCLANKTKLESPEQSQIAGLIEDGQQPPQQEQIDQLTAQAHSLQEANSSLNRAQGNLIQSLKDLARTQKTYQSTLADVAVLLEDAQLKRHLADTANGLDSDNILKMTLTTFVLAAQLAEVARAATLHLERMTHGRYQLKHSDARKGSGKSGLDILVHDTWHSSDRAAATLSGGETFMASLSLALGLADVVQARSGGIDIATLFVDEGFGTLDENTLEEVMNTLDSLREGGRVIGLISHVSELKNRIPQQILLTSSPEGSQLDTGNTAY